MDEENKVMDDKKKVMFLAVAFVVLVAAAASVYYFFVMDRPKVDEPETEIIENVAPIQPEMETVAAEPEEVEPLSVGLEESDGVIRERMAEISPHTLLTKWLAGDDIIRKFVAAVDNVAHGLSPRPQIGFFKPQGEFSVVEKDGAIVMDPASFRRYDPVTDVFSSLDTEIGVRFYRQLEPLMQKAYRELGYPGVDFRGALIRAAAVLLEVSVVESDVRLKKKLISYEIVDPDWENMNQAQKHLFRMGPENVRKIQRKIRDMAEALGVPADRLPKN